MKKDYIVDLTEEEAEELMDEHWVGELVRCKDCWEKGNPYLCRFDRDLEEHGSHRTEADDDWFCADGEKKVSE